MTTRRARTMWTAVGLAVAVAGPPSVIEGAEPSTVYVTVDRSHLIDVPQPVTKVSVANPAVADVAVVSPTQMLVNGKAAGMTTLMIFHRKGASSFELVVHPGPVSGPRRPSAPGEPYGVLVQRADKLSSHLFVQDGERLWVELGTVKAETEAPRK